jgi:hypothetical protein
VTRRRAMGRNPAKVQQSAAPKAPRKTRFSAASKAKEVAWLTRERDDAAEQLSATSEVLRVISRSPGELEPVFTTILGNAVRICRAKFGTLYLCEGDGSAPSRHTTRLWLMPRHERGLCIHRQIPPLAVQ